MKILRTTMLATGLILAAFPLLAQEPRERPEPGERHERLEQIRIERMREALELTEQQAAEVARAMDEVQRTMRESREREREALVRLRANLRSDSPDQNALRESIAAIEREREAIAGARRQEADRLRQQLNVEQQAKLMLFTRQFDERLRQLVHGRGGPQQGMRQRAMPGHAQGMRGREPGRAPGAPGVRAQREPATREERISHLRERIAELQQRITELENEAE